MNMNTRNFDIILFGATGFTGKLVAHYLASRISTENFKLAIAGRDFPKLQTLSNSISQKDIPIGIITADVGDIISLRKMAAQGHIVISTIGPYNWYGEQVIRACLDEKANYLDITGEPSFVQRMFSQYHQDALKSGLTFINCCGFDSIPADIGVWLTARVLPVERPKSIRTYVRTNATFSGGTWTTVILSLFQGNKNEKWLDAGPKIKNRPRLPLRLHFSQDVGKWAIPMPVIDPLIVKRSVRNLPDQYGTSIAYAQFFTTPSLFSAIRIIVPITLMALGVKCGPIRNWLFRRFKPGTGPDASRRAQSYFEVRVIGEADEFKKETILAGGDPGYNETAKMLSQTAFTLLGQLRENRSLAGFCTPVEALGMELVTRLQTEGIRIETHDYNQGK